jgi:hypothetical protein
MKKKLEIEKKEQAIATEQTNKLLDKLKIENEKAAKKEEEVNKVKSSCEAEKSKIEVEKEAAMRELAAALPFQEAAVKAGDAIDKNQIKQLRTAQSVADPIRLVVDSVLILFLDSLLPVTIRDHKQMGKIFPFVNDSYDPYGKALSKDENFVKRIIDFTKNYKDNITDEQCELMEPYL